MTIFYKSNSLVLHADVKPVEALPGQHHLKIQSQLLHSKNPDERRDVFAFTGGGESLRLLGDILHKAAS
ncbi:hypothetical protein [Rhodoferax mekongensis]|uniref:Uncharacterized protein n=1 Tax=Rhodoferax mekongensis TaxID=3068341 RepID=A0ABZ0B2D1_9BURK|nr:hypothetical protein [Rhodoferax sp. TBRC 17307]WNO06007.1 hypothetical protein RAN89_06145 [Rhodoferax sp. TBRC 17307]